MDSQGFDQSFCISSSYSTPSPHLTTTPFHLLVFIGGPASLKDRQLAPSRAHMKTEEMELYVSLCCLINRNLMDKD